jgi:hypothetical protein
VHIQTRDRQQTIRLDKIQGKNEAEYVSRAQSALSDRSTSAPIWMTRQRSRDTKLRSPIDHDLPSQQGDLPVVGPKSKE